jgi:hypothetical protein
MFFRGFCLLSVVCLLFANAAFAQEIQVLRISAEDERATVRTADGKIKMIKVGDVIKSYEFRVAGDELKEKDKLRVTSDELKVEPKNELQVAKSELKDTKHGTRNAEHKLGLRVTEISEGRIVFEERTKKGLETVIIRIENGKQKIERISKVGDAPQVIYRTK